MPHLQAKASETGKPRSIAELFHTQPSQKCDADMPVGLVMLKLNGRR